MTGRGALSKQQVDTLLRPIKPKRVMQAQGQSHIPAFDITAHLNRMFGFGGWDKEIKTIELVEERENKYVKDGKEKVGWYVTYRCLMRLTIFDEHGNVVTVKEDGACGSASNLPVLGDAHDFAYKNAISYAVKRCAKDLGDQFGLSLYNKGSIGPLVGTTLVGLTDMPTGDPQDHAPEPKSLGNDERQEPPDGVDGDTGEIVGGGAAPDPTPAAPPANTQSTGNRAGATTTQGGARTGEPGVIVESAAPAVPQDAHHSIDAGTGPRGRSAPAVPPADRMLPSKLRKLMATLKGAGISDDTRHAWASKVLERTVTSFTELTPADGEALLDAAAKQRVRV